MSIYSGFESYPVNDKYEMLIPDFIYEEFTSEMDGIITFFKLMGGYKYYANAHGFGYRFSFRNKQEDKGCYLSFETSNVGLVRSVEIGLGRVDVLEIINHDMERDILGSLRKLRERLGEM